MAATLPPPMCSLLDIWVVLIFVSALGQLSSSPLLGSLPKALPACLPPGLPSPSLSPAAAGAPQICPNVPSETSHASSAPRIRSKLLQVMHKASLVGSCQPSQSHFPPVASTPDTYTRNIHYSHPGAPVPEYRLHFSSVPSSWESIVAKKPGT